MNNAGALQRKRMETDARYGVAEMNNAGAMERARLGAQSREGIALMQAQNYLQNAVWNKESRDALLQQKAEQFGDESARGWENLIETKRYHDTMNQRGMLTEKNRAQYNQYLYARLEQDARIAEQKARQGEGELAVSQENAVTNRMRAGYEGEKVGLLRQRQPYELDVLGAQAAKYGQEAMYYGPKTQSGINRDTAIAQNYNARTRMMPGEFTRKVARDRSQYTLGRANIRAADRRAALAQGGLVGRFVQGGKATAQRQLANLHQRYYDSLLANTDILDNIQKKVDANAPGYAGKNAMQIFNRVVMEVMQAQGIDMRSYLAPYQQSPYMPFQEEEDTMPGYGAFEEYPE